MSKVFVFCNNKGCTGAGVWHPMYAVAEDGEALASHMCSSHGWARHDMGIDENGWKRDLYAAHYPNGFVVEWVENPETHAALQDAFRRLPDPEPRR